MSQPPINTHYILQGFMAYARYNFSIMQHRRQYRTKKCIGQSLKSSVLWLLVFDHGYFRICLGDHNGNDISSQATRTVCSGADQRKPQSSASLPFSEGNPPVTGADRWFPSQRSSNTENISICWRHHVYSRAYSIEWLPHIHSKNPKTSAKRTHCDFYILFRKNEF